MICQVSQGKLGKVLGSRMGAVGKQLPGFQPIFCSSSGPQRRSEVSSPCLSSRQQFERELGVSYTKNLLFSVRRAAPVPRGSIAGHSPLPPSLLRHLFPDPAHNPASQLLLGNGITFENARAASASLPAQSHPHEFSVCETASINSPAPLLPSPLGSVRMQRWKNKIPTDWGGGLWNRPIDCLLLPGNVPLTLNEPTVQ